jgi:hypothetical protein
MGKTYWVVLAVTFMVGCRGSSTYMISSWKDPGTTRFRFQKIAVVAATESIDRRRQAEDQLARLIPRAAPTYPFFSPNEVKSPEAARDEIRAAGYDGVVVMRLIQMTEDTTYVPASPFSSFGWDNFDWDRMGVPLTEEAAVIETRVYSITEDKLLWSGRSKTLSPASLGKTLPEVVTAAAEQMRKDGLIPSDTPISQNGAARDAP